MDSVEERTRKVIEAFCKQLPKEIGTLTRLLETSQANEEGRFEALEKLRFEAHRMVGSATCMGFPFIGDTFASIEAQLSEAIETRTNLTRSNAVNIALQLQSVARLIVQVRPENSKLLRDISDELVSPKTGKSADKFQVEFFAGQRIAFADDDVAIRSLVQNILSSLGLKEFGVFPDGESLLAALPRLRPNLIITDWLMEPGDGMDVLKAVRSGEAGVDETTSVMFLTSLKTLDKVNEAIQGGVDDFLVKPFTVNMVKKCITRSAQIRAARGAATDTAKASALAIEPDEKASAESDEWLL